MKSQFQCHICFKVLSSNRYFCHHINRIHKPNQETDFLCIFCMRYFASMADLSRHILQHTNERPFFCRICQKEFSTRSNCATHEETHKSYRTRNFHCTLCKKKFFTKAELKQHQVFHKAKKFTCLLCSKTFHIAYQLERHMKSHTGEKPYSCSKCSNRFTTTYALRSHLETHNAELFECKICNAKFKWRRSLMGHMERVHEQKRPHSCKICTKTFYSHRDLDNHIRTHTNEKPFKCSKMGCGKSFASKRALASHLNSISVHNSNQFK